MAIKAYYTLFQFNPDIVREERLNLALLLQCPELEFAKMALRPRLKSSLAEFYPQADSEILFHILTSISRDFVSYSSEPDKKRLVPIEQIHPTRPGYVASMADPLNQLQITQPRTIVIRDSQSVIMKFNQLYDTILEVQEFSKDRLYIDKHQLKKGVEDALALRGIKLSPPYTLIGSSDLPTTFDSMRQKANRRHLQYVSFDQMYVDSPIEQIKRLMYSVRDVRATDSYKEDQVACVLQAPSEASHKDYFASTLKALHKAEIPVFLNESSEIGKLAHALESSQGLYA